MNPSFRHINPGAAVRLLRPIQWLKNGFVLMPMFFAGHMGDTSCWRHALVAVAAFCMASSAVYCMNDILDADADRQHPRKCRRPVASGQVSPTIGWALAALMAVLSLGCCLLLGRNFPILLAITAVYLTLNAAYCLWLKHLMIIDVVAVALCYVLRVVAGGEACSVWLSPWIVCLTFLLALFLAFAKRREDVVTYLSQGIVTRKNATRYILPFLDITLGILAGATLVCYLIYTLSPEVIGRFGSHYLYLTSVFVLAGTLRYLQLALANSGSGNPIALMLRDRFLQVCLLSWLIMFFCFIYL